MSLPDSGSIGKRIAGRRISMRATRDALADYAGISLSYMKKIENDTAEPSAKVLASIAEGLAVSLDYLVKGEGG